MDELENTAVETVFDLDESHLMDGMYLTFNLGKEGYGIEIRYVIQIVAMQGMEITPMPEMPDHYKGVINWRGTIIPVVNMRVRFNVPECEYDSRTCIIIISMSGVETGLIVDSISEVLSIDASMISIPPSVNDGGSNEYITGVARVHSHGGDTVKVLLDCQKLFVDLP